MGYRAVIDRCGLHCTSGPGAARYEEINCVFVDITHGLCDIRFLYIRYTRYGRRHCANDLSWFYFRSLIFVCWCSL